MEIVTEGRPLAVMAELEVDVEVVGRLEGRPEPRYLITLLVL